VGTDSADLAGARFVTIAEMLELVGARDTWPLQAVTCDGAVLGDANGCFGEYFIYGLISGRIYCNTFSRVGYRSQTIDQSLPSGNAVLYVCLLRNSP
jgi:hypothetical protein